MQPLLDQILTFNLIGSTLVFYVAARLYVLPKIGRLAPRDILLPILLLHSMRHLGMMFLAPGAVHVGMPQEFTWPAGLGDLLSAVLAFAAIPAVAREDWTIARHLLWIFNIVGTLDLLVAITLATVYAAPPYMGPAYWIPTFWVPMLLVTHYLVFVVLRRGPLAGTREPNPKAAV